MPTVRLPAPFLRYACGRSLVCCHDPVRAPCDAEQEAQMVKHLASSEAGRAYVPILAVGYEELNGLRVFKQVSHRCVHLTGPTEQRPDAEGGCSVHFLGGLDALAPACRNYPRWVARLPDDSATLGTVPQVEAVFLLACPTAARLLVRDPSPFRFVEVPLGEWIYPPSRIASGEQMAKAIPLREGWWAALANRREEPDHLIEVLDAMVKDPFTPRERDGTPDATLGAGLRPAHIAFVTNALERLPERGRTYSALRYDLWADISRPFAPRQLIDALDIAPPHFAALIEQLIPFGLVHDDRPMKAWLETAARRTVTAARIVDALIARAPFGIDTLLADAFTAAMHVDWGGEVVVQQA